MFTHHATAGGIGLHPTAWSANLQSHLWDCHSSAMHPAGSLTSATHKILQQGYVLCPGTAQANHHCYTHTSSPLLQTSKAVLSSLGFPSAALPPQHHLACQGSLVAPARPQITALRFQRFAPETCSHWHYTSGLYHQSCTCLQRQDLTFAFTRPDISLIKCQPQNMLPLTPKLTSPLRVQDSRLLLCMQLTTPKHTSKPIRLWQALCTCSCCLCLHLMPSTPCRPQL